MHVESDKLGMERMRFVRPHVKRMKILALVHSNPLAGHPEVKMTTSEEQPR